MCYMNRQPPHDCLFVAWGSQEQFEAELTASHPVSDSGSPFQTDILVVAFEVAANATNASLYFGDKHKIPLDLQGDETRVESSASPAPAPTPGASSGQSAGYFMDADYGIAITGVRREPFSSGSTLSLVDVDISVISLRGENGLAPEVNVGVDHSSDVCLGYSPRLECLKVRWGPESQFEAALFLGNEISVEWPRGRGLPIRFGLAVPNSAEQAVIEFGEHRIPIDLRGMTGETPTYDYRLHYQEFTVGSTLYDSNQKKVVLEQVRQEADTGGVTLVFSATNDSEATDFAPVIELAGARVSVSGRVFDGDFDAVVGWTPQTVRIEGEKLAPGHSNLVEHTIARVAGRDQEHWRLIRYSPNAEERPNGVVLQLTVRDSETDAGTRVSDSGHLSYDRTGEESGYWADSATTIQPTPSSETEPLNDDRVFINGGTLNGQRIDGANPSLSVTPGQSISGSVNLTVENGHGGHAIFLVGATTTWGDHESSYWRLPIHPPAFGSSQGEVTINLTAPSISGAYAIIFAAQAETSLAHVMSGTHWASSGPRWDNGDDIAGWDASQIDFAIANGYVRAPQYGWKQPTSHFGASAVKIIVSGGR